MEDYIRSLDMKAIAGAKLDVDKFVELYNQGEVVLLDVRYGFERKTWSLPFTLNIPVNELPDRLAEIPKDKIIVCACPETCRANIAKQYLAIQGYDSRILIPGLLKLMERLKGGRSNDLKL